MKRRQFLKSILIGAGAILTFPLCIKSNKGDVAYVHSINPNYPYSPYIIAPDPFPGEGRWILQKPTALLEMEIDNIVHKFAEYRWEEK